MLYGSLHLLSRRMSDRERERGLRASLSLDLSQTVATDFQIEEKIPTGTDTLSGVR